MTEFTAGYTSWGKRTDSTPLFVEEGPEVLGTFGSGAATVDGQPWLLQVDSKVGARAVINDEVEYHLEGRVGKDHRVTAKVGDHELFLINEARDDWVIEDHRGEKVGQFSGGNNGVRRAILEVEPAKASGVPLSRSEVAALSWFARLLLEARLSRTSLRLIIILIAATLLAVLAVLI